MGRFPSVLGLMEYASCSGRVPARSQRRLRNRRHGFRRSLLGPAANRPVRTRTIGGYAVRAWKPAFRSRGPPGAKGSAQRGGRIRQRAFVETALPSYGSSNFLTVRNDLPQATASRLAPYFSAPCLPPWDSSHGRLHSAGQGRNVRRFFYAVPMAVAPATGELPALSAARQGAPGERMPERRQPPEGSPKSTT